MSNGQRWITDGTNDKRIKNDEIPSGWRFGRSAKNFGCAIQEPWNKGKKLITDRRLCVVCGNEYLRDHPPTRRKNACKNCRRKVVHFKDISNLSDISELSQRTIQKILSRAKRSCEICGWDKAPCDVHHIVEQKNGGTGSVDNLVVVCPNCHREIHANKCYSVEFLMRLSIANRFPNWKEFYHPSN